MPQSLIFSVCLAVVAGLFVIELITALFGGSILGVGSDAPDIDIDADADFDMSVAPADGIDMGIDEVIPEGGVGETGSAGILNWIGARDVPFLIWFVSFLTMFGLFGLTLQSSSIGLFGTPLPVSVACIITFVPALGVTRVIANWVALIMPKTETTALRARHLGGYHVIIWKPNLMLNFSKDIVGGMS